jgi:hypothetical protein
MPTTESSTPLRETVRALIDELVESFEGGARLEIVQQAGADTFYLQHRNYHVIAFQLVYRTRDDGSEIMRAYVVDEKRTRITPAIARLDSRLDAARFIIAAEALFALRAGRHRVGEEDEDEE